MGRTLLRAVRRLQLLLPAGSDAEDALLLLDILLNSFFLKGTIVHKEL